MVTEFIVKGMSNVRKMKVVADVYAGRIKSLNVQEIKPKDVLGKHLVRYENHEWIFVKLPMSQVNEIMQHAIDFFI